MSEDGTIQDTASGLSPDHQFSDPFLSDVMFPEQYSECLKSELVWISDSNSVVSHSQTVPISDTVWNRDTFVLISNTLFCLKSGQKSWDTTLGQFIFKNIYNPKDRA